MIPVLNDIAVWRNKLQKYLVSIQHLNIYSKKFINIYDISEVWMFDNSFVFID